MRSRKFLSIALVLSATLAALHFFAITFYLYWTSGWYDYMMHFLGGLTLGLFFLYFNKNLYKKRMLFIFIYVMILGVGWEVLEYMTGLTFATEGYVLDTFHDLTMDALGVLVALVSATLLDRRPYRKLQDE